MNLFHAGDTALIPALSAAIVHFFFLHTLQSPHKPSWRAWQEFDCVYVCVCGVGVR